MNQTRSKCTLSFTKKLSDAQQDWWQRGNVWDGVMGNDDFVIEMLPFWICRFSDCPFIN